jgi:nucleotide-binding universal stress UspA family protein
VTITHILVPTDFSEYANDALDYAIELAKAFTARLTLLHVIHLSPLAVDDYDTSGLVSYWEEIETDAQQRMQALLNRVHQKGLQGETMMIHDVPFQAILDTAKDKGADLIVMGTHGRTGLTHVLMGSVAERVVRMAPCPVLVTRGKTETSDA